MTFREQLKSPQLLMDLKQRASVANFYYVVMILIVLFADGYHGRHPGLANVLLFLILGISGVRAGMAILEQFFAPRRVGPWLFLSSILLSGLFWGIGFACLLLQEGESHTLFLMVVCTVGLSAGGVLVYHPFLPLAIAYDLLLLGPGLVVMLGRPEYFSLIGVILVGSTYLGTMSHQANVAYWKALKNEELLSKVVE